MMVGDRLEFSHKQPARHRYAIAAPFETAVSEIRVGGGGDGGGQRLAGGADSGR